MGIKNKFRIIKECRLCSSKKLSSLINFDSIALGNNLQNSQKKAMDADEYPLEVLNCSVCNHFQLSAADNPESL